MRVAIVAVMCAARAANAGPWCGGMASAWAPADHHLPVHPHLVLVRSGKYYAGKQNHGKLLPLTATIDGKRVPLATKDVVAGEFQLRFVEVKSDRAGTLKLTYGERYDWRGTSADSDGIVDGAVEYTIDPKWRAPAAKPVATVTRYHGHVMMERAGASHDYDGAAISVDVPAIAFTARWRRDAKDTWRTMQLPALVDGDHAVARLGQTACDLDIVPLGLLEQGIELELTAKLPDGKDVAIDGLPSPFVVPPAKR